MKPTLWTFVLAALLATGAAEANYGWPVGGAMFAAPAQSRPGDISAAHFLIDNRGEGEAVPVRIHQPLEDRAWRAEVTSPVSLAPSTVIAARTARTVWEYRTLTVPAGGNVIQLLAPLGEDGWELTGSESTTPQGVALILKRPR